MSSSTIETEYMDIANRNAWPIIYQKIGQECQSYPYTCQEAKKPQNKPLNRYRDVNPYDHSRVILRRCEQDYINANLVKLDRANRKYILTQGPLFFTVPHFWLMVWEQNSRAILMLNKIVEKNEIKCHWYWPHGVGDDEKMVLSDVKLSVKQISAEDCSYYITRLFRITDLESSESREVVQFHYTTWPDFGVPTSPVAFLEFLKKVRLSGALDPDVGPAVVHCSAGIGRSGTFCLVDSCLVIIEKEGMESLNIQQVLLEMRKDRMGLIQTPDQLRFSYQAIIEGSKRLDPNFKDDGTLEESIYSVVAEEGEEEAPPPPPRAESLTRAPARPLPAIPTSASLGNLNYSGSPEGSSSEDEEPPSAADSGTGGIGSVGASGDASGNEGSSNIQSPLSDSPRVSRWVESLRTGSVGASGDTSSSEGSSKRLMSPFSDFTQNFSDEKSSAVYSIPGGNGSAGGSWDASSNGESAETLRQRKPRESQASPSRLSDSTQVSRADGKEEEPSSAADSNLSGSAGASEGASGSGEGEETPRQRKNRELSELISKMKRKVVEAEQGTFQRSIYKPLTITFGFILVGIAIYTYVKH